MDLIPATEDDLPAVVALVNSAYRGDSSRVGWATEADYLGGQRTDVDTLREDLAATPGAALLTARLADGAMHCAVWIEPAGDDAWYLGMLTVRPDLQAGGHGRALLAAAENAVRARGGRRVRMTVITIRDTLIAWYQRRGYALTEERRPFPYGDERFGLPTRDDLEFVVMEKVL